MERECVIRADGGTVERGWAARDERAVRPSTAALRDQALAGKGRVGASMAARDGCRSAARAACRCILFAERGVRAECWAAGVSSRMGVMPTHHRQCTTRATGRSRRDPLKLCPFLLTALMAGCENVDHISLPLLAGARPPGAQSARRLSFVFVHDGTTPAGVTNAWCTGIIAA
jgi:hypothetical protein